MAAYKRTEKVVSLILEALENGSTRRAAAAAGGICRDSLTDWMKDSEFAERVTLAEGRAEASVAGALYKAALNGDYRAADLWLRRRRPESWSDIDPIDREIKSLQLRSEKVALAAALHAAQANNIPTEPEAVTP